MRPERHPPPEPEVMYHVGHRKYNIDQRCPWWQRVFFRWIYLPFVRFSFKHVHIPAMDEVEISGKKMTFCWYEDGGVFDDEHCAELACRDRFSRVKPIIKNRAYPVETAQLNGHKYPLADKPDRYAKPTFALMVKDRKQDERQHLELAECLNQINKTLAPHRQ